LYRMHGCLTGAYDIPHLAVRNRVVLTNKTPSGLVRGFGGQQVYFALERLMQRIAIELNLDPLAVYRRNFVQPDRFPYSAAAGALLDSGDYPAALELALRDGGFAELSARRDAARALGRLYGIGFAAVVEPSISNMGYITTVLTPEARAKAGPKNGAIASATVAIDPLGSVTVNVASAPAGQGHSTVLAQVVADVFGLQPADVCVNTEFDTQKDTWSVAAGNYSSRFAGAVAGTAHLAATKLRDKLARAAAAQLRARPEQIVFRDGKVFADTTANSMISFQRLAAAFHWSPAALLEELRYGADGAFLSGTFADYLVPTSCEVPEPVILHLETPSPFTPLGAKGLGEGNNMSTPVCIANTVADALGVKDIELPLTPAKVIELIERMDVE
jgi:2-furoyl-CoA dehydrogenase large subunit